MPYIYTAFSITILGNDGHFRYYLMQKAKAATTVGILVGTLATGNDIIMTSSLSYTP